MTPFRLQLTSAIAVTLLCSAMASRGQTPDTPKTQETAPAASATVARADEASTAAESGASQVRIVRLSQVRGTVQLDRNTGREYEGAFPNIPVVKGVRLRTGQGVAEVEFEDNSSLRIGPDSEVTFDDLSRMVSGDTVSIVRLNKGMAYVSLTKSNGNVFKLLDGNTRIVLSPGTHVRLDGVGPQANLAVFDGNAQVEAPAGLSLVGKKQALAFDPNSQTPVQMARNIQEHPLDEWDTQETNYHKRAASFAGTGNALYGSNDLAYYGSFVNMPGCGSMWRPYFASAAWDPFSNGLWAFYPGAGYSWVSPYPWGWLPFHSGTWASCGGAGWGWRPGGQWYGVRNAAIQTIALHPKPHQIPPAPLKGGSTLIPVNTKPLTLSGPGGPESFVFRRDSAGLGVPRETFGHLNSASGFVAHHGVATTSVYNSSAATTLTTGLPLSSMTGLPVSTAGMPSASSSRGSTSTSSIGMSGGGHSTSAGSVSSSAGSAAAGHH